MAAEVPLKERRLCYFILKDSWALDKDILCISNARAKDQIGLSMANRPG